MKKKDGNMHMWYEMKLHGKIESHNLIHGLSHVVSQDYCLAKSKDMYSQEYCDNSHHGIHIQCRCRPISAKGTTIPISIVYMILIIIMHIKIVVTKKEESISK